MTFPLSKEEHRYLDEIEQRFQLERGVNFTDEEYMIYEDVLRLLCHKKVLLDVEANGGNLFALIGEFSAFRKWLNAEESKYKSVYTLPAKSAKKDTEHDSEIIQVSNLIQDKLRKLVHNTPSKEIEIQDAIENIFIMNDWQKGVDYDRELGEVKVSVKKFVPDFVFPKLNMCIEVKLLREGKQSQIVEEICADISGYSQKYEKILFIVYDLGIIRDCDQFTQNIENNRNDISIKVIIIKH